VPTQHGGPTPHPMPGRTPRPTHHHRVPPPVLPPTDMAECPAS
jgi:hypothetical protein